MLEVLDGIVQELLDRHVGGIRFFDELDASWRSERGAPVTAALLASALAGWPRRLFVSTGRFGLFLHNRFPETFQDGRLLLVSGGLRTGAPVDDLGYARESIRGRGFALLDDSFYAGTTRNAIRGELERQGGALEASFIIYDGSPLRDPTVTSLYRYYDHFAPDPASARPNVRIRAVVRAVGGAEPPVVAAGGAS